MDKRFHTLSLPSPWARYQQCPTLPVSLPALTAKPSRVPLYTRISFPSQLRPHPAHRLLLLPHQGIAARLALVLAAALPRRLHPGPTVLVRSPSPCFRAFLVSHSLSRSLRRWICLTLL